MWPLAERKIFSKKIANNYSYIIILTKCLRFYKFNRIATTSISHLGAKLLWLIEGIRITAVFACYH